MNEGPKGERFRPMPLRRDFWREYPKLIKEGTLVLPEDRAEQEDARNAAQAIMIEHIERELISTFKRPALSGEREFYAEFHDAYIPAIIEQEFAIWDKIGEETDQRTKEVPLGDLDDKSAAYLTLSMLGHEEPPQSFELYSYLPILSRAYESLLRDKYGNQFTNELFYEKLQQHMRPFLLKLISMNAITIILIAINATTKETQKEGHFTHADAVFDPRSMDLGEDDSVTFAPEFIDLLHDLAKKKEFKKDAVGRTEDRGCPVLYSNQRDAVLDFSIRELVEQHKLRLTAK